MESIIAEFQNDWVKIIALTLILIFMIVKQLLDNRNSKKNKNKQETIFSAIVYKLNMLIDQYKNHLTNDAAIILIEHTLNYNKYNILSYLRRIIYINDIKNNKEQVEQKIEIKLINLAKESKNKLHKFKYKDIELSEYLGDTYVNSQSIVNYILENYDEKKIDEKLEDYLTNSYDLLINEVIDRLDPD